MNKLSSIIPEERPAATMDVKRRIAANFSRAASSYDQAAGLQNRVAARAMLGLPGLEQGGEDIQQILDLGAGTGHQTRQLSTLYPQAAVMGMDLAWGMVNYAKNTQPDHRRIHWCLGDIEALPFMDSGFDLIFSSLAIQWCQLDRVLNEVRRVLRPGGRFVFSTLAQGSLKELDLAWRAVGEYERVNRFDSGVLQKQQVHSCSMVPVMFSQKAETVYYPDVISLLRSLKALGVNTVLAGRNGLVTRSKLKGLQQAYESFRTEVGLPLTYQVLYGVLQKTV